MVHLPDAALYRTGVVSLLLQRRDWHRRPCVSGAIPVNSTLTTKILVLQCSSDSEQRSSALRPCRRRPAAACPLLPWSANAVLRKAN